MSRGILFLNKQLVNSQTEWITKLNDLVSAHTEGKASYQKNWILCIRENRFAKLVIERCYWKIDGNLAALTSHSQSGHSIIGCLGVGGLCSIKFSPSNFTYYTGTCTYGLVRYCLKL